VTGITTANPAAPVAAAATAATAGTSVNSAETLGHVHSVSGSQATVGLLNTALAGPNRAVITVGRFLKIQTAKSQLVGVITEVSIQNSLASNYAAIARVDLMGEIITSGTIATFRRGVSGYPTIRDTALPLSNKELRIIFDENGSATISIGSLQQDTTVNARIEVDEMLNKHFAVLGSTGVGKSTGVAHILNQTMKVRPNLRVFLLDAHNEYHRSFGTKADVMNPANLRLPFWLFNFEEIVDVFFAGRPGLQEEADILAEIIPIAKASYTQYKGPADRPAIKRTDAKNIGYTVDTPVPYRLADLLAILDDRMGKLENRSSRMIYQRLITRIETVSNDPRYAFMFERANVGGDTMAESISQLFRLPPDGKTMTIMQLAGFPSEVVEPVVSVLTRLAFDFGLWSDGAVPLLFVCEEAHKYASADRTAGFAPTRRALARIAKEGRKHGVYLGLVTQRPAELDPTIISQCGTLFAMRMSNDRDQALLRSAVSDHGADLFAFVPSLGTREALAFGAGVPLPTRLTFPELTSVAIPKSESFASNHDKSIDINELDFISAVVDRWRRATMSQQAAHDEPMRIPQPAAEAPPLQPATPAAPAPIEANRLSLLKKPIAADDLNPLRR
jgi:DNA helicase HerA-like ATPase